MKGGHTDNYYYQLIQNVRKYKGVSKPVAAGEPKTIKLSGGYGQWESVSAVYYDHLGDTGHRNSMGDCNTGPYVNSTGRNDIVESRVARDDDFFYLYAKTAGKLTSYKDPDWMLLYIDSDQDHSTGWEGYDLLVNKAPKSGSRTTVSVYRNGAWEDSLEVKYNASGSELMVAIPRELIGSSGFDFHWCDNVPVSGDITDFFVNGDNAPERRFNYRYQE
jgi:hypothetical protein